MDIALGSWKLPVHMIEAESYLGVRSTDLRYLYTCEDGVRLNYVLRPSHSDVRFGTRSQSVLNHRSIVQSTCTRTYRSTVRDTVGDPYAVPCRAGCRGRAALAYPQIALAVARSRGEPGGGILGRVALSD